jgi:hypothetical protein
MPMISRQLATSLLRIFRGLEASTPKNARKWADAYARYAKPAIAGPAIPVWTGTESSKMVPMLLSAMSAPSPSSAVFAAALANAVETFWLLPPVVFTPPGGAGAVTAFPGKAVLIAGLTAVMSAPQPEAVAAEAIAAQLDAASRTVVVTYAIPPAPPVIVPIT